MGYRDTEIIYYLEEISDELIHYARKPVDDKPWSAHYGITWQEEWLWRRIVHYDMELLLPEELEDTDTMDFLGDVDRVRDFLAHLWRKFVN